MFERNHVTFSVPTWIRFHPFLVATGQKIYKYLPFLLPHDKDYYGFVHLAKKEQGLFVDVGANDGISALGFRKINTTYTILSIEPNPFHEASLKSLKTHIKNFDYKIVGAGDKSGQKILYIPQTDGFPIHTAASLDLNIVHSDMKFYFPHKNITIIKNVINVIALDSLALDPDIVKLDIQGYELAALYGLKNTIGKYRPFMLVEYVPKLFAKEIHFFANFSYGIFLYDYHKDRFVALKELKDVVKVKQKRLFGNIFFIPKEKQKILPSQH